MHDLKERSLLRLIDLVYSCAGGEAPWPVFLEALGERFGASVVGINANTLLQAVVGVDPRELDRYQNHYVKLNPWLSSGWKSPEGNVVLSEESLTLGSYRRTGFYNEWGKKNLVTHAIGGAIRATPSMMLFLSINRGDSQEPFDEEQRSLAQALMPHLQRAIHLQDRINVLNQRTWALDSLAFPMMHVSSPGGVLLWANKSAGDLLRKGDGLFVSDGRIRARNQNEDARLRKLLSENRLLRSGQVDGYGGWVRVTDPATGAEMSVFLARPPQTISQPSLADSSFLIFVANQSIHGQVLTTRLQEMWGLTVAESALAVQLLETEGLPAAAANLGISRNTVKTQLASVFRKSGARRQSELARKVLAVAFIGSTTNV